MSDFNELSQSGRNMPEDGPGHYGVFVEEKTKQHGRPIRVRKIGECIEEGKSLPALKKLYGQFFHSGEICVLCGDTGLGKSINAVQIAHHISQGNVAMQHLECELEGLPVLYYDFELGDRQFAQRYPNVAFQDRLYRADMNPDCIDFKFSVDLILEEIDRLGVSVIIIDNISALIMQGTTVDQEVAMNLMKNLKDLQMKRQVSILILAHTPKTAPYEPLTINHVGGSKAISNFADSVFFIGRSKKGIEHRYLKQVKCRNAKELDGVLEIKLNSDQGLFFDVIGLTSEEEHLEEKTNVHSKNRAIALKAEGKSDAEIAKELDVDRSTVFRWLRKLNN
jgi:predicted ATP-dependent serine protease